MKWHAMVAEAEVVAMVEDVAVVGGAVEATRAQTPLPLAAAVAGDLH